MNQKFFTIFVVLISLIIILSTVLAIIFYHNHNMVETVKNTQYFSMNNDNSRKKNSATIRKYIKENNINQVKELLDKKQLDSCIYSDNESATLIPTIVYSAIMGSSQMTELIISESSGICCAVRYCEMYELKDAKKIIIKLSEPFAKVKFCNCCKRFFENKNP